jgi:hypothetical protein
MSADGKNVFAPLYSRMPPIGVVKLGVAVGKGGAENERRKNESDVLCRPYLALDHIYDSRGALYDSRVPRLIEKSS